MKKFTCFALTFCLIVLLAVQIGFCVEASTVAVTRSGPDNAHGPGSTITLTIHVTTDEVDGSFTATTIASKNASIMKDLIDGGYRLERVETNGAVSGEDDIDNDTDLVITTAWGTIDILGGAGTGMIDKTGASYNTSYNSFVPKTNGTANHYKITEALSYDVIGNTDTDATCEFKLMFVKP